MESPNKEGPRNGKCLMRLQSTKGFNNTFTKWFVRCEILEFRIQWSYYCYNQLSKPCFAMQRCVDPNCH